MQKLAVTFDANVLVDPFAKGQTHYDSKSLELMEYCAARGIGIINRDTMRFVNYLADKHKKSGNHYEEYRFLMRRLKSKYVPLEDLDEIGRQIATIYERHGFTAEFNRMRYIVAPERFMGLARDLYREGISKEDEHKIDKKVSVPESGDLRLLGFAVLLKADYGEVFVASTDKHIIRWDGNRNVIDEIEKQFGIRTRTPTQLMEEISLEMPRNITAQMQSS